MFASFLGATVFVLCKKKFKKAAVLVITAAAAALVWQSVFYLSDELPDRLFSGSLDVTAEITSYSELTESGKGTAVHAKLDCGERKVRAIVYINKNNIKLSPGDEISMSVKLYKLENTEYFAEKTYYKSRYTDVRAMADDVKVIKKSSGIGLRHLPSYLAKQFSDKISELYSDDNAAFMKSLILGDRSELSDEFADALSRVGLSHAVSVSGMHIGFIVAFLLFFTKNKYLKLAAIPVIFLFAMMVGAPQSALRAVIMQTLLIAANLRKREYDSLTALAFSAFVLVAVNPYCATDISFALSFLAMLGIILFNDKIFCFLKRFAVCKGAIGRKLTAMILGVISVSVSASLFTSPILSYTFNYISVIAPLINAVLNIPITLAFTGGFVSVILGFISPIAGKGAAHIVEALNYGIINSIKTAAKLPSAEVFTGEPTVIVLICFICLVLVYAIAVGRKRIRVWFSVCVLALSVVCTVICMGLRTPEPEREGIRFDVLDVGQGQCVVATAGDTCAVIDCGGDKDAANVAISHIRKYGISDIDAMIMTHAHADHSNGAEYLLDTISAKTVYMPYTDKDNAVFVRLADEVGDVCQTVFVEADAVIELENMEIKLLTLPQGSDENENGIVVLVRDGDYEMLITGDIPDDSEKLILDRLPDCESYIVGHHGSKTSSSQALLNKTLPELAVISVGAGNTYGHPASDTLKRLEQIGTNISRTDIDGTVTFYSE